MLKDFVIRKRLLQVAVSAIEKELTEFVLEIAVQRLAIVRILADRANAHDCSLAILTDDGRLRRLNGLVAATDALPLLDASFAEAVLALAALFRINHHHLTDATDKVRVELLRAHLSCLTLNGILSCTVLNSNATESSWIELNWDIIFDWFAH